MKKRRRYQQSEEFFFYGERKDVLRELGFSSYEEYLMSPLWGLIRTRLLPSPCSSLECNNWANEIHHMRYSREVMKGLDLSYLFPVCSSCHRKIEIAGNGNKRKVLGMKKISKKMFGVMRRV